jgi:hypothetical protein
MTAPASSRDRFRGALVIAAAAALTLPGTLLVLGPFVGRPCAFALHWLGITAAHVAWLAPGRRRAVCRAAGVLGLGAAGLTVAALAALPVVVAAPGVAAVALAVARGGRRVRAGSLRALLVEGGLGLAALALVGLVQGPSLVSAAAASWGFWLVQSVHPLLPGPGPGGDVRETSDAFERAAARLESLLEEA